MPRITVVTPYFPISERSRNGRSAFETLRFLRNVADLKVICPLASYPNILGLSPKSYDLPDLSYSPPGFDTTYLQYPALPVVSRPINGYSCQRLLREPLRASKPDLVLNYWIYPEGFGAVRAGHQLGVPVIVGAIGSDLRRISGALIREFTRKTLVEADGVITVSHELRQRAIAFGVKPENATAILNGSDTSVFYPGDRDEARRNLGVDSPHELIVFVGSLLVTKGLFELLEAFIALSAARPHARLAVIGDGPAGEQLKRRASEAGVLDRIVFAGRQTSEVVSEWMRAADVFCLPSHSEGCPNVIVEALSCGRPIVATNVGGIPELLTGDCGAMIPPHDAPALCRALDRVLSQSWDAARIAKSFSRGWEEVAEETFAVCQRVMEAHARAKPAR